MGNLLIIVKIRKIDSMKNEELRICDVKKLI